MEKRTGEILAELLISWGVDHIYGMPGDSINEFMDDLRKKQEEIKYIQVRHEETGALAASAYAKLTGKLGVCMAIAGPGAIHLLNGLYDAKEDGVPVLAIAGQVASTKMGTHTFQELHLDRVFQDVAVFCEQAQSYEQLPDLLNMAIRKAYSEKGPAVLIVPDDLFAEKQTVKAELTSAVWSSPSTEPNEESLSQAAAMINDAKKPVIFAGRGVRHAKAELIAFAEKIKAPIVFSLLGKGILPDYHHLNLGQHGQIGTKPAYEAIMESDLLIFSGTSFPYRDFLPDKTKAIQIEIDPGKIGNFYPVELGLCGDSQKVLNKLGTLVMEKTDDSFVKKYEAKMDTWFRHVEEEKLLPRSPMQAPQVMNALEKVLADDAVISSDVGNVTVWTARYLPFTNQDFILSGRLATMGCGLPGAIAAKLAQPDRQVIAICGDGGFAMGMQDFVTAVKYKLPVKVLVLNNSKIGMIKYEQAGKGHMNYETDLGNINFAEFAKSCGGEGFRAERIEDLEDVLQQAFLSSKPAVIDVVIEDKAPLPGKLGYQEAVKYSEYLIKNFFHNKKVEFPDLDEAVRRFF